MYYDGKVSDGEMVSQNFWRANFLSSILSILAFLS